LKAPVVDPGECRATAGGRQENCHLVDSGNCIVRFTQCYANGPERTRWAVRDADLKYVREYDKAKTREYLFDLAADVGEKHNLLATRPDEALRLKAKLADWERQVRPTR